MRQVGIIAACGEVALEEEAPRLVDDHRNARALAEGLARIPGLSVDPDSVETNMVFIDCAAWPLDAFAIAAELRERGVLVSEMKATQLRLVTHRHFRADQVDAVVEAFGEVASRHAPA